MDGLLHLFGGILAAAAMNGALWAGAVRAAGALPALSPLDRLGAAIVVATAQVVGLLSWAGLAGGLRLWVVGPLSLGLSAALWALPGARAGWLVALGRAARDRLRATPALAAMVAPAAAAWGLVLLYAAPRPPLGFDPVNYHLTLVAHALRQGDLSILFFPPYFDLYSYLPANADLLAAWSILPLGCDLLLPFVNLPFALLLGLAVYGTARDLGQGRGASAAAAGAACALPATLMIATEAYAEIPLWALALAAARLAVAAARERSGSLFAVAAAAAGVVVGTKSTGFLLAATALGAGAATACGIGRPRNGASRWGRDWAVALALAAGGTAVFGSAWYLRNWIEAGNPLFPVPVSVAGYEVFPGEEGLAGRLSATTLAAFAGLLWDNGRLVRALVGDVMTPESSWGLGPAGIAAILAGSLRGAVALARSLRPRGVAWRPVAAIALAGAGLLATWPFLPYSGTFLFPNVRFAVPGTLVLGLAALGALARAGASGPGTAGVLLGLQAAGLAFSAIPVTAGTGIAAALALPFLAGLAAALLRRRPGATATGRPARLAAGALVVAGSLAAAWGLHQVRERDRVRSYREARAPFQLMVGRYADCLDAVERAVPEGRLAVALEARSHAFLYPLFGSHLQRDLVYVNLADPDLRAPHLWPFGNPRVRPDREAWLRHLAQEDPAALLVLTDRKGGEVPPEAAWAEADPARFELRFRSDDCELFVLAPGRMQAFRAGNQGGVDYAP